MNELERLQQCCTKCGSETNVAKRYSYGYYAGRLCVECAHTFADHCGLKKSEFEGFMEDDREYEARCVLADAKMEVAR